MVYECSVAKWPGFCQSWRNLWRCHCPSSPQGMSCDVIWLWNDFIDFHCTVASCECISASHIWHMHPIARFIAPCGRIRHPRGAGAETSAMSMVSRVAAMNRGSMSGRNWEETAARSLDQMWTIFQRCDTWGPTWCHIMILHDVAWSHKKTHDCIWLLRCEFVWVKSHVASYLNALIDRKSVV